MLVAMFNPKRTEVELQHLASQVGALECDTVHFSLVVGQQKSRFSETLKPMLAVEVKAGNYWGLFDVKEMRLFQKNPAALITGHADRGELWITRANTAVGQRVIESNPTEQTVPPEAAIIGSAPEGKFILHAMIAPSDMTRLKQWIAALPK